MFSTPNIKATHELQSNFIRDCKKPTLIPVEGSIVAGEIPKWLCGTLIRNGAGIQTVGSDHFKHKFDGLAILHRFHIYDGKVTYNSRPLESDSYKNSIAAGKIVSNEFGTLGEADPCDSLFSKLKSSFERGHKSSFERSHTNKESGLILTDNCNVNVGYFGNQLYAMTETPRLRQFSPTTLETIGPKTSLDKYLPIEQASAHPHVLDDGTMVTMGTNFRHKKGPRYVVISVPPTCGSNSSVFENSKIVAEIPCRWKLFPSYSHSFSLAGNKVVFVEQPYCFSLPRLLLNQFWRSTIESCLQWWPNQTTRIHVVSTVDGNQPEIIYETKDLFIFHQVNAYEEDGNIILDLSSYNDAYIIKAAFVEGGHQGNVDFRNTLRRYVLPLHIPENTLVGENLVKLNSTTATAKVRTGMTNVLDLQPEILYSTHFELPKINYEYNGKKYRYAYGATSSKCPSEAEPLNHIVEVDQILKLDLEERETVMWTEGEGNLVSEPIFVPNPLVQNTTEDDGILLVTLLHLEDERKVTLVILNAKTMETVTKIEFVADGAVPSTVHGQWASAEHKIHKY